MKGMCPIMKRCEQSGECLFLPETIYTAFITQGAIKEKKRLYCYKTQWRSNAAKLFSRFVAIL